MTLRTLDDRPPLSEEGRPLWIAPEDLRAGDVLLSSSEATFHGTVTLPFDPFAFASPAWWVRMLDGGWYSHASYYDGDGLIEATLSGVKRATVEERVQSQRYVDAYRFTKDGDEPLGSEGWPVDPINTEASAFLGKPYAQHDLAFIGVLAVSRRLDVPGELDDKARLVLAMAVRWLKEAFGEDVREHLTCSELVYRAFAEALPEARYRLGVDSRFDDRRILPARAADISAEPAESSGADAVHIATLEYQFAALYALHKGAGGTHMGPTDPAVLQALAPARAESYSLRDFARGEGGGATEADYVTPRDLAESPNLRELGRISREYLPGA